MSSELSSAIRKTGRTYNTVKFINDRITNVNNLTTKLIRERTEWAKNLFSRDLKAHFGCVNAIEFSSNGGELIASGTNVYLSLNLEK